MFGLFKKDNEKAAPDVKGVREQLLRFIKEQLRKAEGGEGRNIRALYLYLNCPDSDRQVYEAAVYLDEEDRFRNEIQRIADDFAIDLPENWAFQLFFTSDIPAEAVMAGNIEAALFVETRLKTLPKSATARIRILSGEAEKEEYLLHSGPEKITIGREKKVQTADGFFRLNTIAFPAGSQQESNRFVSRQHAHIEFDQASGNFLLFADEGGIPPRNKVKIRTADGNLIKLQAMEIGHPLEEGDQIILGDSAVLEFRWKG